jgi:hypothetical protein
VVVKAAPAYAGRLGDGWVPVDIDTPPEPAPAEAPKKTRRRKAPPDDSGDNAG